MSVDSGVISLGEWDNEHTHYNCYNKIALRGSSLQHLEIWYPNPQTVRLHLIAISKVALSALSHRNRVIITVYLGYSEGICWGVKSRPGFVLPRNGEILWAHSARLHPIACSMWLGHGDEGSRKRVKNLIGNEIEHDIRMSTIKSHMRYGDEKRKEWETILRFNDDWFDGCM